MTDEPNEVPPDRSDSSASDAPPPSGPSPRDERSDAGRLSTSAEPSAAPTGASTESDADLEAAKTDGVRYGAPLKPSADAPDTVDEGRETDHETDGHEDYRHDEYDYYDYDHEQYDYSHGRALTARAPEPVEDDELEEEDYGGPVKGFLEHLEDLRWVLIRSIAAIVISMIVCLVGAPYLTNILRQPLERAQATLFGRQTMVSVQLGTNVVGTFGVETNKLGPLNLELDDPVIEIQPIAMGTNMVLAVNARERDPNDPQPKENIRLKNFSPVEGFIVALQLALYGGIGLASPFVLFFVGDFVLPALKRKEKQILYRAVIIGAGLFALGVVFCYYLMLHVALYAAANFSGWLSFGADEWRASSYIGFICKFMLGMGLGFELPVIILSLVKLGLLSYRQLSKGRPYWIVVNMVLSSTLTPPDPGTMLLMALPLQLLYEISVFVAWIWDRQDRKRREAEDAADTADPPPPRSETQ